jgi:hypothetical protein
MIDEWMGYNMFGMQPSWLSLGAVPEFAWNDSLSHD